MSAVSRQLDDVLNNFTKTEAIPNSFLYNGISSGRLGQDELPELIERAVAVRDGVLHRLIHLRVRVAVTLGLEHGVPRSRECVYIARRHRAK
jgi:hypothetical protein